MLVTLATVVIGAYAGVAWLRNNILPHCYLLGTADAALDIWFETHALANAQLSARTQRHVLHQVHDASGAAKLSSREPRPSCRASNIRGRVATNPLTRTRRRNEWN
jgi:hypothetical protein